jgi:iron complex transport system permease protein
MGGQDSSPYRTIIMDVRLPRIIAATLVGMALSASGAAMQALFRNPMADPFILGTSSGAALGISLGMVLGVYSGMLGFGIISIMGFIFALLATMLVMSLGKISGKMSNTGILLSGVVVSSFLLSIISLLYVFNHDKIASIYLWTMGGFNGVSWDKIELITLPIIFGVIVLIIKAREFNAIVLGEEHAAGIGMNVDRFKIGAMIITAILVSFSVFVSGIIGFVGIIVPHLMRMIFGVDHKKMILLSAIGGGIFLLICDTISRAILGSAEIPVGIVTSLFGAPFFLLILRKTKPENML